jgi:hypothetical protein
MDKIIWAKSFHKSFQAATPISICLGSFYQDILESSILDPLGINYIGFMAPT